MIGKVFTAIGNVCVQYLIMTRERFDFCAASDARSNLQSEWGRVVNYMRGGTSNFHWGRLVVILIWATIAIIFIFSRNCAPQNFCSQLKLLNMQPESCSRSKDKYILNVPIFNRACNPSKYKTDISSNLFIYWVSMTKTMMMATMAVWAGGQWIWNVPQTTVLERTMGALQHPNPLTLIGSLLRVEPTLSLFSLSLPLQLPLPLSCHPFTSTFTIIICVTWQKSCQLEVDLSRTRIWDPQLLLISTILILDQCHHLCSMYRVNVSQKKLEFWIIRTRSFVYWTHLILLILNC